VDASRDEAAIAAEVRMLVARRLGLEVRR